MRVIVLRVLLIAYEFPPSPSPQSLRWTYLVRELLAQGVQVHVLTVEGWWPTIWIQPPEGAVVHRARAGGLAGVIAFVKRWRRLRGGSDEQSPSSVTAAQDDTAPADAEANPVPVAPPTLNWKGRIVERLNQGIARVTFPDERGRWEPFAAEMLEELLESFRPDVVISSHEPATSLRLGRRAKEAGFAWVADLGDPVLSFYTPVRWKKESMRVERWTCRNADHVTVTTEAAKWMLAGRHDVRESRLSVLTQGYDATVAGPVQVPGVDFDPAWLELLYTGSFYQFREPRALVDAVLASPQVRLTIATSRVPDWLLPLLEENPEQLRLLGFLPHAHVVSLQRSADVLVNIANDDPVHVPGKVYEYLGAGRPILHLGDDEEDVAARLIRAHRRGVVSGNGVDRIAGELAELAAIKRNGAWTERFSLDQAGVERYQWQDIARRLLAILRRVAPPAEQG